jgi:hypothetical protein
MNRLLIAVAFLGLLAGDGATAAESRASAAATASYLGYHVYVPQYADASQPLFRPHSWTPTGNGSLRFTSIRWSAYDGPIARATAISFKSSCRPSCADGRVARRRARLKLDLPKTFECAPDIYVYSRLRYKPRGSRGWRTLTFSYCDNRFS